MALEHALLVALREQPASGLDLARRFEKSIGFFWHATHQQIYRVLARMEGDGWVTVEVVPQTGRPDRRVYTVSAAGRQVLADWLAEPVGTEPFRSELAVKLRGASYGDRATLLGHVADARADHETRLAHYRQLEHAFPADPTGHQLDQLLVLRGGIRLEEFWIAWLTDYLDAHGFEARSARTSTTETTETTETATTEEKAALR
ncbi:PadR family transcriptional regulator [Nocardioides sp. Soil805]|uniref:PadR family transcriptional regulator n=1 Tax=Nocardioides sp. Soil805 TaxID=1736416 RepID=UPI0009EA4902|nr:PadR family transcriptional regulator [Nocardioides sp. Soil805]